MPHDAVKQGLRDLLRENAEILLESWIEFSEALHKHMDGEDSVAMDLLGNLWVTKGNITLYNALDMDEEQQTDTLRDLTQELKDFIISEDESRGLLAILMYAAGQEDIRRADKQDTPEAGLTDGILISDDGTSGTNNSVATESNSGLNESLLDAGLYDLQEPDMGSGSKDELYTASESDLLFGAGDSDYNEEFQMDMQPRAEAAPTYGEVTAETKQREENTSIADMWSSDEEGLQKESVFVDRFFEEAQKEMEPVDEASSPIGAYTLKREIESLTAYCGLLIKREEEGLPMLSLPLHMVLTGGLESERRDAACTLARHACELGLLEEYTLYEGRAIPPRGASLWYIKLAEIEAYDLNRIARTLERTDFIAVLSGSQKELIHAFGLCDALKLGYVHQIHLSGASGSSADFALNVSGQTSNMPSGMTSEERKENGTFLSASSILASPVQDDESIPEGEDFVAEMLQSTVGEEEMDRGNLDGDATETGWEDKQETSGEGVSKRSALSIKLFLLAALAILAAMFMFVNLSSSPKSKDNRPSSFNTIDYKVFVEQKMHTMKRFLLLQMT